MKKKIHIAGGLLIVLIAVCMMTFFRLTVHKKSSAKLQTYAERIMSACRSNQYKLDCYNSEIPKLMNTPFNLSMEEAFQITRIIQNENPTYSYCYELGRSLSAAETKKNPENWKNVVARCPATMCNNGCLHGVLMERYRSMKLSEKQINQIIPDLKTACQPHDMWHPVGVEIAMCHYGLGNLLMNVTGHDPKSSAQLCKVLGKTVNNDYYTYSCIRGVFMTMYQQKDNAVGKTISVSQFCSGFTQQERSACLDASWQLDPKQAESPEGAIAFCTQMRSDQEIKGCYSALLQVATISLGINRDSLPALKDYCLGLPEQYRGFCFGTVASRLLLVDPVYTSGKALKICNLAQNAGYGPTCYEMLIDYAQLNFHKKSSPAASFCRQIPPQWALPCKKRLL